MYTNLKYMHKTLPKTDQQQMIVETNGKGKLICFILRAYESTGNVYASVAIDGKVSRFIANLGANDHVSGLLSQTEVIGIETGSFGIVGIGDISYGRSYPVRKDVSMFEYPHSAPANDAIVMTNAPIEFSFLKIYTDNLQARAEVWVMYTLDD